MRPRQDGMALLAVLLLVATMTVLVIGVLDDIRFGQRRTGNLQAIEQAQREAEGSVALAGQRLSQLARAHQGAMPPPQDWSDLPLRYPLQDGQLELRLHDAGACFNLNGVVAGGVGLWHRDPAGARQYQALLQALQIDAARARALTDALVDWIDTDQQPQAQGAEDSTYGHYRTGDTLLAEPSELRAIAGYDAATYARIRPQVCALPVITRQINVNALRLQDAPVLVALTQGSLDLATARAVIAARPAMGWRQVEAFFEHPALRAAAAADAGLYEQIVLRSRYFTLYSEVDHAGARAVMTALLELDAGGRARLLARRWTPEE